MLCQYCSHIYKEDREGAEAHTECLDLFPSVQLEKGTDKMEVQEASTWHKIAKAKVEAEK